MKTIKILVSISLVAMTARLAQADLTGPYTVDANTLVLLHLDQSAGSSVTPNAGSLGGNFISVNYSSDTAPLPVVTTMLGAPGYSNGSTSYSNCESNTTAGYELGYDYNGDGIFEPDTGGGTSVDFITMNMLNIGNGGQTPFTLEALIQPTTLSGNQEIICTDSDASNRGFQFRITGGSLQFQFITGSQAVSATIPTSGNDAFVAGTWYHVAMVYNGTTATLYWTLLNATNGAAHVLGSPANLTLGASDGTVTGPLIVGNRGRPDGVETFLGAIDEVRISNVARAANQMQFFSPLVTITQNPVSQNVDYNQPVTFSVGASSLTSLSYQWLFNSNSIADATNGSYSIPNVAAANAGYYACAVTNAAGNSATSSQALLVVGAANFLNHRYSFTTDDTDSIGGANGTNFGDATVSGGKLVLDGTSGTYMQLPPNLFNAANASALTVEFWATYGVNTANAYVFAFGNTNYIINSGIVGVDYLTYSPHNANGQGLLMSPSDSSFQQSVTAAGNLDGLTYHVDCVINPPDKSLAIYTNGVLEAVNTNFTVNLANVDDALSFVGKSLFAADPYLNASIDELRIYNGALSPISIQQSDVQGPNTILAGGPVEFAIQPTNTTVALGHTVTFSAAAVGYLPITYQWFKNGTLVAGATNTSYSFATVNGDDNATIVCYATNTIGATTYVTNSTTATLTVHVPRNLTWSGTGASWDVTSLNWTTNANVSQTSYTEWDNATFDSLGSAQPNVNLAENHTPTTVTVSVDGYSLGGAGAIVGSGTLLKSGSGTLTLTTSNTFSGGTTINGGNTIELDGSGLLGTGPIVNNGSIIANVPAAAFPAAIFGVGGIGLISGTATLSASNSYAGPTAVSAGTLFVAGNPGLGQSSTVTVSSGAQIYITGAVNAGTSPLTLSGSGGDGSGVLRKNGGNAGTYGGAITLAADTTINIDGSGTLNLTNAAGINGSAANANLTLNGDGGSAGTVSGPVQLGTGGLTVNGPSWSLLGVNNDFSGLVTVAGALNFMSDSALGNVPGSFNAAQITLNSGTIGALTNASLMDGNRGITINTAGDFSVASNSTFTVANPISGSAVTITKSSPGTLVLMGDNSTTLSEVTLNVDTASTGSSDGNTVLASPNAMPSGSLNVLNIQNNNGGSSTLQLDGTSGAITVAPIAFNLSGRNNLVPAVENLAGSNTFNPQLSSTYVAGGGTFQFASDAGTLTIGPTLALPTTAPNGSRTTMFSGSGNIVVASVIQDSAISVSLTNSVLKTGSGTLTLQAANTYVGSTIISNGVLLVDGSIAAGGAVICVGGSLGGSGSINTPVSILPGAALAPGDAGVGTLTINSSLTIAGNLAIEVNKSLSPGQSNDVTVVSGALSNTGTGTVNVSNLGPALAVGDRFVLFNQPLADGATMSVTGGGVSWNNNLATDGSISAASLVNNSPTNIIATVSGGNLTLSWPADHTGWELQAQTNSLATGLSNNWVTVPGSTAGNSVTIPINPANGAVFYRLVLPQ